MCVQETRRQVYVYRKGRWGLCVCMLARGRVLVIKVSENNRKWLRERERNRESMCVRHPDTLREIMSMCEREMPMHIKCVHLCVRYRDI